MPEKYPELHILCGAYYGDGWDQLVDPLVKMCKANNVEIHQIKEKYGTLRFYVGEAPDEIISEIDSAEEQSQYICEYCGKPGETRTNGGWFKTWCEECEERTR